MIFSNKEKNELGKYKIHIKDYEMIYIVYSFYSLIKKHIELLNKNFYSHGNSKLSRSLCYRISVYIQKYNDFITELLKGK